MSTLVDEWVRAGVTDAVVCPGNRSTLMSLALAANPAIELHSFVDERSAGFFALGIALSQQRPVVIWTTSGTAVSELRAAVVEADHSRVPLLVVTADRPPELHHIRDWQSTDQSAVFEPHLRWKFDPGVASEEMRAQWRSIAARSVMEARTGPVHLNLAIREPWSWNPGELPVGRNNGQPWHCDANTAAIADVDFTSFAGKRGVISVGAAADSTTIESLRNTLNWPVIADVRSGVAGAVNGIDALLSDENFAREHRPEVVIHLGEPPVSKLLMNWLATASDHVVMSDSPWRGAALGAAQVISTANTEFRFSGGKGPAEWLALWNAVSVVGSSIEFGDEMCEPVIARALSQSRFDVVFLGTSMPIRDFDTYGAASSSRKIFANRGASGMDGLVSTAAGIATSQDQPVLAVVGDLSFLYDLGAMWNVDLSKTNLTIVVVDNNGGGIFELMPQLRDIDNQTFERLVTTPRHKDVVSIAEALGARSKRVSSIAELSVDVETARNKPGVDVIVVPVDRSKSVAFRSEMRERYKAAMKKLRD